MQSAPLLAMNNLDEVDAIVGDVIGLGKGRLSTVLEIIGFIYDNKRPTSSFRYTSSSPKFYETKPMFPAKAKAQRIRRLLKKTKHASRIDNKRFILRMQNEVFNNL